MKNLDIPKVEMDELWVIVQKKCSRMEDYEDDGPWTWVAFAPGCRLIIASSSAQENNMLQTN